MVLSSRKYLGHETRSGTCPSIGMQQCWRPHRCQVLGSQKVVAAMRVCTSAEALGTKSMTTTEETSNIKPLVFGDSGRLARDYR